MRDDPIDVPASVALLRALANPARLRIALQLLKGEQAVGELESELGIRQPTLSQHLAELRDAGLVATRRASRIIVYRLADQGQQRLVASLLHGFGGTAPAPAAALPAAQGRASHAATFAIVGVCR
jgi:DNA-binding transcriptional ArsR family regulator